MYDISELEAHNSCTAEPTQRCFDKKHFGYIATHIPCVSLAGFGLGWRSEPLRVPF